MQYLKPRSALLSLAMFTMLAACGEMAPVDNTISTPAETASTPNWPASLKVVGDGYPATGDPCRIIGESEATVNFLDDSATLVGCPVAADAAKLGGKSVATIDGIQLVSVPSRQNAQQTPGDGDGTGDAKVLGTDYNATADIRCAGYRKHPAGMCPSGVKRNTEGGMTIVEVNWPGGDSRALFFDKAGKLVSADTSQADGSAAFQPKGVRQGDMTIVTIGPERYEIPDVFVQGD